MNKIRKRQILKSLDMMKFNGITISIKSRAFQLMNWPAKKLKKRIEKQIKGEIKKAFEEEIDNYISACIYGQAKPEHDPVGFCTLAGVR